MRHIADHLWMASSFFSHMYVGLCILTYYYRTRMIKLWKLLSDIALSDRLAYGQIPPVRFVIPPPTVRPKT